MQKQEHNKKSTPPTDEMFFSMLENKYGVGFAQWFIDQLQDKQKKTA